MSPIGYWGEVEKVRGGDPCAVSSVKVGGEVWWRGVDTQHALVMGGSGLCPWAVGEVLRGLKDWA